MLRPMNLPSPAFKAFVFLALAAALGAGVAQARGTAMSESDRSKCLASGGSIAIMGLSGSEGCVHRMPDAGKPCTDGSQCKAGCFLDEARATPKDKEPGARVTGSCAPTDYIFGCRSPVVEGKASPGLCVD